MIKVILYSRQDCHLCDDARLSLEALQSEVPHELLVIDVDSDPKLQKEFGLEVPVVMVGPYHLKTPFTSQELLITLRAAQHREEQIASVDKAIESGQLKIDIPWTKADQFSYWLSRHYLAMFNVFIIVYLGLPVLAPVLMKVGAEAPARLIYRIYGAVCHQLGFRSLFLFGEQYAYPRAAAHIDGLLSYEQVTGYSDGDLWAARNFIGTDQIGYKIALCERDFAIYAGIFVFGLLFAFLRNRSASGKSFLSLPWYLWILIGCIPIGLDGLSQLISQPPLNLLTFRESTPFLRILTGGLFGFMTAWFGYPMAEEAMRDTQNYMEAKLKRLKQSKGLPESGS